MFKFKSGQIDVLVATDIVSRGIDIDDITMVINYDVPHDAEDYVHRIGRTARADRDGKAITFVSADDIYYFKQIESFLEKDVEKVALPEDLGEGPEYKDVGKPKKGNTAKSRRRKDRDQQSHKDKKQGNYKQRSRRPEQQSQSSSDNKIQNTSERKSNNKQKNKGQEQQNNNNNTVDAKVINKRKIRTDKLTSRRSLTTTDETTRRLQTIRMLVRRRTLNKIKSLTTKRRRITIVSITRTRRAQEEVPSMIFEKSYRQVLRVIAD